MRPTFMGFESSKAALFASQKALDIVGHNLSNMSSEGYTRQRTDQVAIDVYAYKNRISTSSVNCTGMGCTVEGVSQVRDERLDTAFRNSYSETSYYSKSNEMLSEIETIMSEIDEGVDGNGYGLSWGIEQMYRALEDFSTNVNISADASIFADSVTNVTNMLNRLSDSLAESCDACKAELGAEVADLNTILRDIATLNDEISDIIFTNSYTEQYGPNEFIDKRNVLLDKLSAFGKVHVENNKDGTIDVSLNGHECVTGVDADSVEYLQKNNGTVTLNWKSDGTKTDTDSGILKASAEIINGRGNYITNSTESTVRGFRYYQDCLDTFARNLTDVLNNTLPAEYDADGNVIAYKKLVGESDIEDGELVVYTDRLVSAENIAISDDFFEDSSYMLYDEKSSDNTYFLQMIGKLSTNRIPFVSGPETFTGTFQEYISECAGKIGSDVYYANYRYEACEQYSNEMLDSRDNVTGVSESEETVSMLTYNRAFQAAAKMMTTMDEMLDVIINQVGALG
ncbi:MAG: flagellar hook-associated protein FlgK [Oscillospiraceae bacterium]|nr:flagellar hook-associated protein FlgK [Oscillospiraceae bacterium]